MTRIIRALVLMGLITGVVFAVRWWLAPPVVTVEGAQTPPPLTIHVESTRPVGIRTVIFWSRTEAEYLWAVYVKGRKLTYGDQSGVSQQLLPRGKAKPRPLKPGEVVYVSVVYAFDRLFPLSASGGEVMYSFEIQSNGTIKALGKLMEFQLPEPPEL